MAARHDPKAVAKLISFGTTQDRKMFPHHFAPDRLGIEVLGVRGSPFLGPGSYLGPENILKSSTSTRPMSTRGYVMGARTAPRFQKKAQAGHLRHPGAFHQKSHLADEIWGSGLGQGAKTGPEDGEDAGAEGAFPAVSRGEAGWEWSSPRRVHLLLPQPFRLS
ncbi:ciliary microtubule-associated protein 3 isoform X4 [Taeniopygia guttata]|uniref:ciliary microtubule-associated protein 3 isoform X4 n=1 Tax=Taeniopygia guttata TaxID=59729 RepID=UPI003BB8B3EF